MILPPDRSCADLRQPQRQAPDRGCPNRGAFENESPKPNETCSFGGGTLLLRQPRSELGVRTAAGLSTQPRSEPEKLTEQRRRSRN